MWQGGEILLFFQIPTGREGGNGAVCGRGGDLADALGAAIACYEHTGGSGSGNPHPRRNSPNR